MQSQRHWLPVDTLSSAVGMFDEQRAIVFNIDGDGLNRSAVIMGDPHRLPGTLQTSRTILVQDGHCAATAQMSVVRFDCIEQF